MADAVESTTHGVQTPAEPADDADVVHVVDEAVPDEAAHEQLVAKVASVVAQGTSAAKAASGEPDRQPEQSPPEQGEGVKAEGESEEPSSDVLSEELWSRAQAAGFSKDLAERLQSAGQLEETLAAFDRALIDWRGKAETPETSPEPAASAEKAASAEPVAESRPTADVPDEKDLPPLDPEIYDEALVQRDAYYQRRLKALEARIDELVQEREVEFDRRFDRMIDGLGYPELFGVIYGADGTSGSSPVGLGREIPKDKQANRDTLFRAYMAICDAYNADPMECDPRWAKRAVAAMFPDVVFKQAQRQTVERLRDAQGKFLSSAKPRGAPPARQLTEEEANERLVADVAAYLRKQGVQMSGV